MKVDPNAMATGMVTVVVAAAAVAVEAAVTRAAVLELHHTTTWQLIGISPPTFWLPAWCFW